MGKKIIILGVSFAAILAVLFIYRQANRDLESLQETVTPSQGTSVTSPVESDKIDENIEIVDQASGVGIGKAEGFVFVKPGEYEIRFARRVADGTDTIQLSEPQVTLYYRKVIMQITAQTLTMPAEFSDMQSKLPSAGSLRGQVKLLLYQRIPTPEASQSQSDKTTGESSKMVVPSEPQVTIELDHMNYTREFSLLTSNGPVRIEAEQFKLAGSDLTLQYDQINDRLQELQLQHLDKLQMATNILGQADLSADQKTTTQPQKDEDKGKSNGSGKKKGKEKPIAVYRLSFSKNVIINQRQEKLLADSLEIITEIDPADANSLSGSAESSKATEPPVPPVTESVAANATPADSTVPPQQTIEYAELTCDGPLRIISLDEKPAVDSLSRRLEFVAYGQPAIIQRNNDTVVSADVIRYRYQNQTAQLQASAGRAVMLSQGPHQQVTAQKEINFDSRTGLATLFGPGQVEYLEKGKDSPAIIKYNDQMIIKSTSSGMPVDTAMSLSDSSPEWMEFNGRLAATMDLWEIQADQGRITFLPKTEPAEKSSSSPKVKTVELTGNVYMSDPNSDQITADRLEGFLDPEALAADPNADIKTAGEWLITGSPACVRSQQQGQIQSDNIRLDLAKNQCAIDGPGNMTAQIGADLVGVKAPATKKNLPIQINWQKRALYSIDSGNITVEEVIARIEDETQSISRQSTLTCSTMDITLTADPNDPNSQKRRLNQFVAQGPQVILASRQYDKASNATLSDMQMQTPCLRFDNDTQLLTAEGPGWIEIIDIANEDDDPNKADPPSDGSLDKLLARSLASASAMPGASTYTLVHFLGPMLYHVDNQELSFTDGLALHRIPIDNAENVAAVAQDPYAWSIIPDACQLHCDNLRVTPSSKSNSADAMLDGAAGVAHLYADGNVVFEFVSKKQRREFLAGKSFDFDNKSKDITITGSSAMPVRFNQAQLLQFRYNLGTGAYSGTPIGPSIIID